MEKNIFTKSIFKEKYPEDGKRISIMSRHTENDGKTPDKRIVEGTSFEEWLREFAPPEKLVGAYYREEISWEEFEEKYINFLRSNDIAPKVKSFARRCQGEIITLLCAEEDANKCHRRLLAEELQRYEPDLKIIHR